MPGGEEGKRKKLVRENLVIIGFFVSLNFLNLLQRRISFEIFRPTGHGKCSRERKRYEERRRKIFFSRRRNRMAKEKEENIWIRKNNFCRGEEKRR